MDKFYSAIILSLLFSNPVMAVKPYQIKDATFSRTTYSDCNDVAQYFKVTHPDITMDTLYNREYAPLYNKLAHEISQECDAVESIHIKVFDTRDGRRHLYKQIGIYGSQNWNALIPIARKEAAAAKLEQDSNVPLAERVAKETESYSQTAPVNRRGAFR